MVFEFGLEHALVALATMLVFCMLPSGKEKEKNQECNIPKRPSVITELRANYHIAATEKDENGEILCQWDETLLSVEAVKAIRKAADFLLFYDRSNGEKYSDNPEKFKQLNDLDNPTRKAAMWGSAIELVLGPLIENTSIIDDYVIDEGESIYITLHSMLSLVYYNPPDTDYGRWNTDKLDMLELPLGLNY